MTIAQLRTHPDLPLVGGVEILLDWFDGVAGSTVHRNGEFLQGLHPSQAAIELFSLAGGVYCLDRLVSRSDAPDGWTRNLDLTVPVADLEAWNAAREPLTEALEFLSGDRWSLTFVDGPERDGNQTVTPSDERVALLSGGLDSLAGAIDQLESGGTAIFVGHHDSPFTDSVQTRLFNRLRDHYGQDHVSQRRLYLRPEKQRNSQAKPLPPSIEHTFRSRSLLFIGAGISIASGIGSTHGLRMPENGFIGVNVPLTGSRVGSLSTRTTHPHFLACIGRVLGALQIPTAIENPFRLMTKGEALEACANREILEDLAEISASCAHPERPRFNGNPLGNCGYCYPCLIRRASMHRIGRDSADGYEIDVLSSTEILDPRLESGRSLRALIASLQQESRPTDVLRNGPIPAADAHSFAELYERGRSEMREWISAGPNRAGLARRLLEQ